MADGDGVAQHGNAKFAQQRFAERAGGHARRCFARRSALENVARIVKIEFLRSGQVRVAGPRRRQPPLGVVRALGVLHRQRFFPVFPVAIFDAQRDRRADGFPVAHAGEKVGLILFDALAPAAPVSQLPAVQLAPDEFQIHGNSRGQPGNPGDQRLPVRLSSSDKSQHAQ